MDNVAKNVVEYEHTVIKKLKENFLHYAQKCLKIRTKAGDVLPFKLNKAQSYVHMRMEAQLGQTGKVRALVLKGRQQGMSTYVGGRFYHKTTTRFGVRTFILTHSLEATDNLYDMSKRFYENTPPTIKPSVSTNNSKQLTFGRLDSGYKIGTAENKNTGRSATIQLFHGSEVAFWTNASEHARGIFQTIPDQPGTEVILESTANGVGNYFHQKWQDAEAGISDYIAIFVPWFWQEEYSRSVPDDFKITAEEKDLKDIYELTDGQLVWRRAKIIELSVNGQNGEKSFMQEYPCNSNEAFQLTGEDTFIPSELVMRARRATRVEPYGPLLIGVDPARFGDDRTSIIFRQGRKAFDLVSYTKKDTMEVAGIVHSLIVEHSPTKVMVDVGGLGAGVVDRLMELGHKDVVIGINAGSSALDEKKFKNKRSEMWSSVAMWLGEQPCSIPDVDSLHADLCGIKYSFDSNSRLLMESKESMKKRGIRSSDEADALCLTFALPESAYLKNKPADRVIKSFAEDFRMKKEAYQKRR